MSVIGKGRGRNGSDQPAWRQLWVVLLPILCAGCGKANPVTDPVGWWHQQQGGVIAQNRPPPPGANLPYPKLGTIPPKPVLPSTSFRNTVRNQLAEQRDRTERLAARNPIEIPPVPPGAPPAKPVQPSADTANAVVPAADAPPAKTTPAPSTQAAPAVTLAGAPMDMSGLPAIPAAPPQPATFEGVAAQPAPTPPPPLPEHIVPDIGAGHVLFAPGSAVLDPSQTVTLKDFANRRHHGIIAIEGHGEAASDAPAGQEAALKLALARAQAIAKALATQQHVPVDVIHISATAFGRGATLSLQ